MQLIDFPIELLYEVTSRIKDMASLSSLAGTSRLLRKVVISENRLRVLYECHSTMTLKSNQTGEEDSDKNPFSNDLKKLILVPDFNTHRHALYVIQRNWRWLPVDELEIQCVIDCVGAVKLRELFESSSFKARHVRFACCEFYDGESGDRPLIGLFSALFSGKCLQITFDRCAFEQANLITLWKLLEEGNLKAFHFEYNFVNDMPTSELCRAIKANPYLVDLDMSAIGLGWDHTFLVNFLNAIASSNITHLSLRHNDLGLDFPPNLILPNLPKLKCLNIVGNSLYAINTHVLKVWLDSLDLTELILDKTGIKDIHLWPYPIIQGN